jgi:hypothetical protein
MARAKRHRLVQGKGVKRNGIYIHDQAASFESLPNGPDPNSVAKDIHQSLPRLSKKGTVFRATQAVAEQRQKELQALVESLWMDDHPTLIAELIESRTVTDFFGYWRRDSDLAQKKRRQASKSSDSKPRNSVTSSVFSAYFASDSRSTSQLPSPVPTLSTSPKTPSRFPSFRKSDSRPHTSHGVPSSRESSVSKHSIGPESFLRPIRPSYPESARSSDGSLYEASSHDSKDSTPINSPVIMAQEVPVVFGHNPDYITNGHPSDRPLSPLEPLPEDYELKTPVNFVFGDDLLRRNSDPEVDHNRLGQLYDSPPLSPTSTETFRQPSRDVSSRLSWQSTNSIASSASSYLNGLDIALPASPLDSSDRSRQSICSLSSIRTTSSAEAIIPGLSPTSSTSSPSSQRRSSFEERPWSISENGEWSECDNDSVYEKYLHGMLCNCYLPLKFRLIEYAFKTLLGWHLRLHHLLLMKTIVPRRLLVMYLPTLSSRVSSRRICRVLPRHCLSERS